MPNSIKDHLINIILVSIGYIISMILVQSVIVPAQQYYLPAITTFAALIFPLHGVRVISAWLFGGWSILYLFIANIIMHFVLTPSADFTVKSFLAWSLVSTVAWFYIRGIQSSWDKSVPIDEFNIDLHMAAADVSGIRFLNY